MLQKANYGAVCSESVVLPGLLAGHELTVPSEESGRTAETIHCHNCPAHERGDMDVSHAGPGQVSFQHDPLLKLLHRQQSSVCVPYSRNSHSGVPYYICRDLSDFDTFSMFYARRFSLSCCCCCLKGPQNLIISLGSGGN